MTCMEVSVQPAGMHTQASVVGAPCGSSGEGCLCYAYLCVSSSFLQVRNTKAEEERIRQGRLDLEWMESWQSLGHTSKGPDLWKGVSPFM